jgi:radical SAM protein with 4Fe4S-binding SPASM domain
MNVLKRTLRKMGVALGALDVPLFETLEVEISSGCNLRCATCPNKEHSRPSLTLPTEVIWSMVAELKALGFAGNFSPHFYNEPLLDSRLVDILEHIHRELPNVTITLFTNFTLMTAELYRRLAQSVDSFVVTVDESAVKKRMATVSEQLTEEERGKLRVRSLEGAGLSNRAGAVDMTGEGGRLLAQCDFPEHYMVVDAAGDVHLCCNDYFGKALFGNVRKRPLLDIWRSPAFVQARAQARAVRHPLCRTCFWSGTTP